VTNILVVILIVVAIAAWFAPMIKMPMIKMPATSNKKQKVLEFIDLIDRLERIDATDAAKQLRETLAEQMTPAFIQELLQ